MGSAGISPTGPLGSDAARGPIFTMDMPADPGYISVARMFVASVFRTMDDDEATVEDLRIAVSEIVTNAVKAHASADIGAAIRVVVTMIEDRAITVEVIDQGPGFDFTPPRPPDRELTIATEGSLGLAVVLAMFPDCSAERNPEGGMTVRFTVHPRSA